MSKKSKHNFEFNAIYENHVIGMRVRMPADLGEPVHLIGAEYEEVIIRTNMR